MTSTPYWIIWQVGRLVAVVHVCVEWGLGLFLIVDPRRGTGHVNLQIGPVELMLVLGTDVLGTDV